MWMSCVSTQSLSWKTELLTLWLSESPALHSKLIFRTCIHNSFFLSLPRICDHMSVKNYWPPGKWRVWQCCSVPSLQQKDWKLHSFICPSHTQFFHHLWTIPQVKYPSTWDSASTASCRGQFILLTEDHGLGFGGADHHLGYKLIQWKLEITAWERQQGYTLHRDKILRLQNQTHSTPRNSIHKSYNRNLWQQAALMESTFHSEVAIFVADTVNQTYASNVKELNGPSPQT